MEDGRNAARRALLYGNRRVPARSARRGVPLGGGARRRAPGAPGLGPGCVRRGRGRRDAARARSVRRRRDGARGQRGRRTFVIRGGGPMASSKRSPRGAEKPALPARRAPTPRGVAKSSSSRRGAAPRRTVPLLSEVEPLRYVRSLVR